MPGSERDIARARGELTRLCRRHAQARLLIDGVRVVLVGGPNVGKSTLANALAEREHAIVSDVAGTTRDWVDHPGAIDGAPFTFVDTAGVREADDPIEREAVRRTHEQAAGADIVLHVLDLSMPPSQADRNMVGLVLAASNTTESNAADPNQRHVLVWNKSDLRADPDQAALCDRAAGTHPRISAATGDGLDRLRSALAEAVGFINWQEELLAPITDRQVAACRDALSALTSAQPDGVTCAAHLQRLLAGKPARP